MAKKSTKGKMEAKIVSMSNDSCCCDHPGCCSDGSCVCDMCGGCNCYCAAVKILIVGIIIGAWGLSYIDTKIAGLLIAAGLIIKAVLLLFKKSM